MKRVRYLPNNPVLTFELRHDMTGHGNESHASPPPQKKRLNHRSLFSPFHRMF